jgi:hypothetical protein
MIHFQFRSPGRSTSSIESSSPYSTFLLYLLLLILGSQNSLGALRTCGGMSEFCWWGTVRSPGL